MFYNFEGKRIFIYIFIFSGKNMWNQNFNSACTLIVTKVRKTYSQSAFSWMWGSGHAGLSSDAWYGGQAAVTERFSSCFTIGQINKSRYWFRLQRTGETQLSTPMLTLFHACLRLPGAISWRRKLNLILLENNSLDCIRKWMSMLCCHACIMTIMIMITMIDIIW